MSREERQCPTKCDVSDLSLPTLQSLLSLQLQRWIIPEQHLRRILYGSPSRIDKLLQEHLSKDSIRLIREDCAEDHRHTIMRSLNVNGLLIPVVDCSHLASFLNTLWCSLACEMACLLLECSILVKGLLEGCCHCIAFQQADSSDQVVLLFLCRWEVLKINLNAEIVALLWLDNVGAIFALQHGLSAVGYQLREALYGDGDEDLSLDVRCGDVEGDIVEVGDNLVDGGGR